MSFLHRVAGLSLRDRVRSSDIQEKFRVELLLVHIEGNQLRWFGHLVRMLSAHLPGEVFQACPSGKRPVASKHPSIPLEGLVEEACKSNVWISML